MGKKEQGTKGKGRKSENALQIFDGKKGVVRVSDKLCALLKVKKDGGKSKRLIYKYIPLVNFLKSFYGNYIYLSSPEKWEDPFETQYRKWLEKQDSKYSEMMNFEVFAACFASSLESEKASWNEYLVHGADVIRVAIDYDK